MNASTSTELDVSIPTSGIRFDVFGNATHEQSEKLLSETDHISISSSL